MATADLLESPGPAALIPSWVDDLESFRRWTYSDEFPHSGLFAYLEGDMWVDLSMEELMTHYRVKFAISGAFCVLLEETNAGDFLGGRVR